MNPLELAGGSEEKRGDQMARTSLPAIAAGESGLAHYLAEIRKFPMLAPDEEYMLAKRYKEHGDRDAAHRLVTSHLRLVAKIAMGYRLATYAMWWIRAAIQEYILRSWSLVKMGTTANQKRLFFNLRKVKGQIQALDDGDLRPDQVNEIATRLGVTEADVISMNRRLGGDASLNAPLRADGETGGEWQDWLVDDAPDQEALLAETEELDNRKKLLADAIGVLNDRERRIFEARRLSDDPITLEELSGEFGVSRERVRQIEVRAFEKVQKAVQKGARDQERAHAEAAGT